MSKERKGSCKKNIPWYCPGQDVHFLPDKLMGLPFDCLYDVEKMLEILPEIAKYNQENYMILPLIQNQEACIYGADMSKKAGYWAPGAYPYESLEEAENEINQIKRGILSQDMRSRTIYHLIQQLRSEKIIVELQTPFSLLAGLVDPMILFASLMGEEKERIERLIQRLTQDLSLYVKELAAAGCKVISLADPIGASRYVGPELYLSTTGKWEKEYLKALEPYLDYMVIHLCGQMASDLINYDLVSLQTVQEEIPVNSSDVSYVDQVFALSEKKDLHFIGPGCLRNSMTYTGPIYKIMI